MHLPTFAFLVAKTPCWNYQKVPAIEQQLFRWRAKIELIIPHMLHGASILHNWVIYVGQMLVNIPAPWSIWVISISILTRILM